MTWSPSFKIYDSANTTLIYDIENVLNTNWPLEQASYVEITNLRSVGAIIIPGGNKTYTIEISGVLTADNYTDLTTKIFALKNTILMNTRYTLRVDKSVSTYDSIKVIRLEPIELEPSKRTNTQRFTLRLLGNSWV
ncbi:MAG: hypothetical protein M0R03_12475 [Novosphingobium sp.]|nr:hypothetical protein [Novosphingobium sp.]